MKVDFLATAPQYQEHLRPVYEALDPSERGLFSTTPPRKRKKGDAVPKGDVVVVAAYMDYKSICPTRITTTRESASVLRIDKPKVPVILMEHGAGFTYLPNPRKPLWGGSYAGGVNREHVSLFPSTNRFVAEANRRTQPDVPAPIVGCPKLDSLIAAPQPENEQPVIAFSFHWDCPAHPETRSAFPYYLDELYRFAEEAKAKGWTVVGHGHPRAQAQLSFLWRRLGWEFLRSFNQVAERADLYVCDSSSTIYEFAALGRPVVLLNAPWYRREVQHGLRFWSHSDVGVNCDEPEDLTWSVETALADEPRQRRQREWAVSEVYPYLGQSAPRTAEVIREFMKSKEDTSGC